MRKKKAIINTLFAMLTELATVINSFIIPRLILSHFGSTYNGLTTSISQFLGYAVLLRAGIGGATRAALYKPLADGEIQKISGIMVATKKYMNKIAMILLALIVGFAVFYPLLVIEEFDYLFSLSLFLIIGFSTFMDSMWGISNMILLQADQKLYISSIAKIISITANTVLSVILINAGMGIHAVKLGSTIAFCLYPLLVHRYVKKHYRIDYSVRGDTAAISQRWDVFFHQAANFVMNNTDVMVLTIFADIKEVSVYSVYNLVANGTRKLVNNFTSGMEATFGNMIAKNQQDILEKNFYVVQYIIFSVATIVYSSAILLILEFVSLYSHGVHDVDYIRPTFGYLLMITQFFCCVRQPYQLVVRAAGHYKQTKNGAMVEAVLNIIISVIAVSRFGLVGVVFGTLAATILRTAQYSLYVSKNLIKGSILSFVRLCLISAAEALATIFLFRALPLQAAGGYLQWGIHGVLCITASGVMVLAGSVVFNRKELSAALEKLKGLRRGA